MPRSAHEVTVWHARTTETLADAAVTARALAWLSPAERSRYDRYRHQADRDMFLVGRIMARALVGRALGVAPGAWTWGEGLHGRPGISSPPNTRLSFNIAHSAGVVVCALSADGDVGVDVEHRRRPPIDARMVRRYCAPAEIEDIESRGSEGWRDQFLKYWTLKEAYLKARGLGIAVHLADLSFVIRNGSIRLECLNSLTGTDPDWSFVLDESADTHFLAAAAPAVSGGSRTFTIAPFPADLLP